MERKLFKLRWLLIMLCSVIMTVNILILALSSDIVWIFMKDSNTRETLRTDLYLSSIFTEIICTIGVIGAFRESYRLIKIFTLLKAINCVFSLYISIKAFGLCLITIFNLIILLVSAKYERNMKNNMIINNNNNNGSTNQNHTNISTISDIDLQAINRNSLSIDSLDVNRSPPQYEPPPPYSEELTKLPKIC